jgi:thymidylate kinase
MKDVFSQLNYTICTKEESTIEISLIVINNPDGTPRWILPANAPKPFFLKFYNRNNFKANTIAKAFDLIFTLKLQGIVLNKQTYYLKNKKDSLPYFDIQNKYWALFTGTVGPNNKMLLYAKKEHRNVFYKIATTPTSEKIIKQEESILTLLSSLDSSNFYAPRLLSKNSNHIVIEDVSGLDKRFSTLEKVLINTITEITALKRDSISFNEFDNQLQLNSKLHKIKTSGDERIPVGIIKKLERILFELESEQIETGFSHGDFTPWNMYKDSHKAAVYDWELANSIHSIGFDAFHFIIQNSILIKRDNWRKIKQEIFSILSSDTLNSIGKTNHLNLEKQLTLYLISNTINYLDIYNNQKEWHTQVYWLLNSWNLALSDCLVSKFSARELIILDLFDYLNAVEYTALKFPDIEPEKLSAYSDIDLCIHSEDEPQIIQFLNSSSLVSHISENKKSFMNQLTIVLLNGETLSLDLIWKFKRKNLEFLDAKLLLKNRIKNNFGVFVPQNHNLAQYIGMFYGLNNTCIPAKYEKYSIELQTANTLDNLLFSIYEGDKSAFTKLFKEIKKLPSNKGIKGFKNSFQYMKDTLLHMNKNKGMTITFSGVDGAGKSTVIEQIKEELEKKYRKRVVVIRHRPSLLPILSTYTKGKTKAEQDAANRLPRQGNNKSSLSSFIRFMYYYADYLFGQFYVNFKYKSRGYIVLYDRYYYDFIIDSRRSNIDINESIVKFGYNFVFTPELNFFLYADPAIILKRKQELSEDTITELTKKYSDLFNHFESKKMGNNYHLINNIDLEGTKKQICSLIESKMR